MSTSLLSHSLRPSIPTAPDAANYICRTCRRNAASYRRTRKMLRVKQDPVFQPATTATTDHIIFNPPPSAPNVYHTPSKFLPESDPRRKLYLEASSSSSTLVTLSKSTSILARIAAQRQATQPTAAELKPLGPIYEKKYHLTETEIEEIRRLRTEDPRKWSRCRLAEKFNCSQFFVSLCVTAPELAAEKEKELAKVKSRWGRMKTDARDARQERKKLWGRDA